MNFYKRYMGDFARDTAHLTMLQRGAYNDLLDYYYSTGKPLPADMSSLYRIGRAMTTLERKAVDEVAAQFFPVNGDGGRHNKRADIELAEAHAYADAQAMRAHKRWHKPVDMQAQCPDDASHSHSHRKPKTPLPPSGEFLRFWESWPRSERKEAKGKCWEKWNKSNCDAVADAILAHVVSLKTSERWRGGYIPAPMVYLNERRWEGAEPAEPAEKRVAL